MACSPDTALTNPDPVTLWTFKDKAPLPQAKKKLLAIIDSFTKTVSVIALSTRDAHTLAPRLLDEIFFRRGAPDVIHTDAAPEFTSELLAAILDATGTTCTTTCGHNAQSNGEIESWWRFWNRSMKFLSPADYLVGPSFAQRICFAYNSVPHDSLAAVSPFEMDCGTLPSPLLCRRPRTLPLTPSITFSTTLNKPFPTSPTSH
jgi:transposase InsO family protein